MNRRLLASAALLLLAASTGASTALADLDADAQLGFNGRWVMDAATPLTVTLSNSGAEQLVVEVTVSQGDNALSADMVYRRLVRMPGGTSRDEAFLLPGPKLWSGSVRVGLEVDPGVPIHSPTASGDRGKLSFDVAGGGGAFSSDQIAFAARVVGVVGDSNSRIAARVRAVGLSAEGQRDPHPSSHVELLSVPPHTLRLAPLALGGLEALLVCDPDAAFAADPVALDGLLDWVALGGTLVVSLGEHAGQFTASPLAREMPATWTGSERVEYGEYLRGLDKKDSEADVGGAWSTLTANALATWKDDTAEGGPRRVERRLGMGRIVVLPYDFRTAMSIPWLDEERGRFLLAPIVKLPPKPKDGDSLTLDTLDFSAAVARTLQTGAFEPPPLPLVILGIILYVVVVGPLDWFVLKRLKKERLTTLTFLGAVGGFTLLAYGASLLLFSTGARVNRIVVADLADGGRGGRQLLRYIDTAGYYSPTGADQDVSYPPSSASVVLPSELPGFSGGGDVGSAMPVQIVSADALHPRALVQLAFRSQRVLRVESATTLGSTIEVEWDQDDFGQGSRGVRVVNGLAVDLEDVVVFVDASNAYALGPVKSGETSNGGRFDHSLVARRRGFEEETFGRTYWGGGKALTRDGVRGLLESMTLGRGGADKPHDVDGDAAFALRKSGIDRSRLLDGRHALVVAFASKFPVELPGAAAPGDTYVVLRKEVTLP